MFRNRLRLAILAGMACASAGCTMCPQTPEDYTYAAYGGLIQRADMMHGRVGSAFAPAEGIPAHGIPHEGVPLESMPAANEYGSAYQGPVLMPPEENGGAMAAAADQSQAATTAFDPGDILSSGPQ
jgi:hypothetical protein